MSAAGESGKLSAYVLTRNSERLLERVLAPLTRVADEIVVVDSGSTDGTLAIARRLGCRIELVEFENFRQQRETAQSLCSHDHVLFVDSDEVMSEALVDAILALKATGFANDAYGIRRDWRVLGRPVRAFYPVSSPDHPVRLIDRRIVHFGMSNGVHETPTGYRTRAVIDAPLVHDTFATDAELEAKLDAYTDIAARDLLRSGKPLRSPPAAAGHALGAFVKWYFTKGSWRDGLVGLKAGWFACRYTWRKYRKAAALRPIAGASGARSVGSAR